MKKLIFLFYLFLILPVLIRCQPSEAGTFLYSQSIDELLRGNIKFVKSILHEDFCMPRNEAALSELQANEIRADHFVPAQLGFWITAAILSTDLGKLDPSFVEGYSEEEVISKLSCVLGSLEQILGEQAYIAENGKKALYQVHKVDGRAPKGTDFEKTVSMLDNAYLILGLEFAKNWIEEKDPSLAIQIRTILSEFDPGMWISSDSISSANFTHSLDRLFIGCAENSSCGPIFDRFTSEGRIMPVLALAHGVIDSKMLERIFTQALMNSQDKTTTKGTHIEKVPFFGTALEIFVPTIFLSNELETAYGCHTLLPFAQAWLEEGERLNLPGVGAMGISNGFGEFTLFTLPPSEETDQMCQSTSIIIPPAAAIMAGTLSPLIEGACMNLKNIIEAYGEMPPFGLPNYLATELPTAKVNVDNPMYGTLEILQGATALFNLCLGGDYIERMLRRDPNWDTALKAYSDYLGTQSITIENESNFEGNGTIRSQSNARGQQTLKIDNIGDTIQYTIEVPPGNYKMDVRYSNDDTGVGDEIHILLNGNKVDSFFTVTTGQNGTGWNNFFHTSTIDNRYYPRWDKHP